MSRKKITEEAEQSSEQSSIEESNEKEGSESDRVKLTQRMPEDLASEAEKLANRYGMSRNSLINMAVREWITERD